MRTDKSVVGFVEKPNRGGIGNPNMSIMDDKHVVAQGGPSRSGGDTSGAPVMLQDVHDPESIILSAPGREGMLTEPFVVKTAAAWYDKREGSLKALVNEDDKATITALGMGVRDKYGETQGVEINSDKGRDIEVNMTAIIPAKAKGSIQLPPYKTEEGRTTEAELLLTFCEKPGGTSFALKLIGMRPPTQKRGEDGKVPNGESGVSDDVDKMGLLKELLNLPDGTSLVSGTTLANLMQSSSDLANENFALKYQLKIAKQRIQALEAALEDDSDSDDPPPPTKKSKRNAHPSPLPKDDYPAPKPLHPLAGYHFV